jgi:hypothetical protein
MHSEHNVKFMVHLITACVDVESKMKCELCPDIVHCYASVHCNVSVSARVLWV